MTRTSHDNWTRPKRHSSATRIFGSSLFFFLLAIFLFAPSSLPEFKHRLLLIWSALHAAFFGYFVTDNIGLKIAKGSRIGRQIIKATGGITFFVLVLLWWASPMAPTVEKAKAPVEPYEQILMFDEKKK